MEETLLESLSLSEKEALIKEKGQLIEAQDFYSFFILIYLLHDCSVKAYYDFSGTLIDVEEVDPESENRDSELVTSAFLNEE